MSRQKNDKHRKEVKKKKHSPAGIYSCVLSAVSFVLLFFCAAASFAMKGKAPGPIGGAGLVSLVFAVLGCHESLSGKREREMNHITCKVGLCLNMVLVVILAVIFIAGLI